MSTLLIILLILTVGHIVWLIIDLLTINKNWIPLLFILIIVIGLIGWGFMGTEVPTNTKNIEITTSVEILKSSTTVFVEVDNKVWEFKEHQDYVNINDSTSFYYVIDYNMYNSEVSRQLKYKN